MSPPNQPGSTGPGPRLDRLDAHGRYHGDHVTFTLDPTFSGLSAYAALDHGATLVSELRLPTGREGWPGDPDVRSRGNSFRLERGGARIQVLDTPHAMLLVHAAPNAPVYLELAPDVALDALDESERTRFLLQLAGATLGWLGGRGIALQDDGIVVNDRAMLRLGAPEPADPGPQARRGAGGRPLTDRIGIQRRGGEHRVPFTLAQERAGAGNRGPVLVLDLDERALDDLGLAQVHTGLEVRLDGQALAPAASLAGLLDETAGPGRFLLLVGEGRPQVLVHLAPGPAESPDPRRHPAGPGPLATLLIALTLTPLHPR